MGSIISWLVTGYVCSLFAGSVQHQWSGAELSPPPAGHSLFLQHSQEQLRAVTPPAATDPSSTSCCIWWLDRPIKIKLHFHQSTCLCHCACVPGLPTLLLGCESISLSFLAAPLCCFILVMRSLRIFSSNSMRNIKHTFRFMKSTLSLILTRLRTCKLKPKWFCRSLFHSGRENFKPGVLKLPHYVLLTWLKIKFLWVLFHCFYFCQNPSIIMLHWHFCFYFYCIFKFLFPKVRYPSLRRNVMLLWTFLFWKAWNVIFVSSFLVAKIFESNTFLHYCMYM